MRDRNKPATLDQEGGRLLLGYGGTQSIEAPGRYSDVAKGLLREIGIDVRRFYKYYDQDFEPLVEVVQDGFQFGLDALFFG